MRVVVIGGTGHIGTYLVPRLIEDGHDVVVVTRGQRDPYHSHGAWSYVERTMIDRQEAEENGSFGKEIAALEGQIVIDLICFTPQSGKQLVDALQGRVQHFLLCGTIWVHGHSAVVPTSESQPRKPFGDYGIRKAALEKLLLDVARLNGFPATVIHPGHIVGPGWTPINPAGNMDLQVFEKLAHGQQVTLPNLGMETLHHVHADDVAQVFMQAIRHRSMSLGESFHAVSPAALTLRGYAEAVATWFGREANLSFMPFDQWKQDISDRDARLTHDHIAHSPNCSIDKARLLGYEPRYSSLQAIQEALTCSEQRYSWHA